MPERDRAEQRAAREPLSGRARRGAVRNVDRATAEDARELVWAHSVSPKDAIHVATALRAGLRTFDTFDRELLKLDGRLGSPPMRIARPRVAVQLELPDPKDAEDENDE